VIGANHDLFVVVPFHKQYPLIRDVGVHGPPAHLPQLLLRLEWTLLHSVTAESAGSRKSTFPETIPYIYSEKIM
jgi:hypothetical protein